MICWDARSVWSLSVLLSQPSCCPVLEVLPEHGQVGRLNAEVKLKSHHLSEICSFIRHIEPLQRRHNIDDRSKSRNDAKIAADHALNFGVENFDGNVRRRDSLRRALDEYVDVLADVTAIPSLETLQCVSLRSLHKSDATPRLAMMSGGHSYVTTLDLRDCRLNPADLKNLLRQTSRLKTFICLSPSEILDSDMMLFQPMDELFFLPTTTIAMPRAYWLLPETRTLSSLLAVIEPSYREYTLLKEAIKPAIFGQLDLLPW